MIAANVTLGHTCCLNFDILPSHRGIHLIYLMLDVVVTAETSCDFSVPLLSTLVDALPFNISCNSPPTPDNCPFQSPASCVQPICPPTVIPFSPWGFMICTSLSAKTFGFDELCFVPHVFRSPVVRFRLSLYLQPICLKSHRPLWIPGTISAMMIRLESRVVFRALGNRV